MNIENTRLDISTPDYLEGSEPRKIRILFFLDLVQDLDLILPLVKHALVCEDFLVSVGVSDRLYGTSPRVAGSFEALSLQLQVFDRTRILCGWGVDLSGFDVLVTASESNARPHAASHRLAQQANRLGLKTYTIQHGLENVGLTYFDKQYKPSAIHFASQKIFIWGNKDKLHKDVLPETIAKCISVGYPKEIIQDSPPFQKPKSSQAVISVFENLHWERYSHDFTNCFLGDLKKAALIFPQVTFLVKPHHDERWSARCRRGYLAGIDNILLADPADPRWEPYTAASFFPISDAAITTPSTVAVDAAAARCVVAVVGYDLDTTLYEPLFILRSFEDWALFIQHVIEPGQRQTEIEKGLEFFSKNIVDGSVVQKMLGIIREKMTSASNGQGICLA